MSAPGGASSEIDPQRSALMSRIRARNTKPELVVRRLLHHMGYRFRLHKRDLPGKPDIAFPSRRKVIDVRGCFWHRHLNPGCVNAVLPQTRREWWLAKLQGNVERDARNLRALADLGWETLIVWECETRNPAVLVPRLVRFLGRPARMSVHKFAGRLIGRKTRKNQSF
jgi:DNA mismatch endonuclease Vsr